MSTFLKTLIGGALGVGALYVVGKVCYEIGKDVAEVERQLQENEPEKTEIPHVEQMKMDLYSGMDKVATFEEAVDYQSKNAEEEPEKERKPTMLGRAVGRIRNAKLFLTAKKAFDKSGKSPGILSSLLTNPDGARIEAFVRDGGVQISVKPRTA